MSTTFSHFFEKINQFSPLEYKYTEVLNAIALTPKILYFRGKIPENVSKNGNSERPKTVAIVGSRHNTKYGEKVAYELAYKLAKKGVIIVSGLAFGIDTIAHKGCLDAGGTTIAVLGTSIDRIYPTAHLSVARRIVEQGGAIISEYAPHTPEYNNISLAPGEYLDDNGNRKDQGSKNLQKIKESFDLFLLVYFFTLHCVSPPRSLQDSVFSNQAYTDPVHIPLPFSYPGNRR